LEKSQKKNQILSHRLQQVEKENITLNNQLEYLLNNNSILSTQIKQHLQFLEYQNQLEKELNEMIQVKNLSILRSNYLLANLDLHLNNLQQQLQQKNNSFCESYILTLLKENSQNLIKKELPHNSPFRRSIIYFLSKGMDDTYILKFFNIDKHSLARIKEDGGKQLKKIKYAIKSTKNKISLSSITEVEHFFNDYIPILSGRNYRLQIPTDKHLYEIYQARVSKQGGKPLGYSTLIYKFLQKENIHHSKDDSLCPICVLDADNIKKQKHQELKKIQLLSYLSMKKKLGKEDLEDCLICIQDFTQIPVQSTFYQNLIITFYKWNNENSTLEHSFEHFIGSTPGEKNEVYCVSSVWQIIFTYSCFNECKKLIIWSDGGPKHFKLTANLYFFSICSQQLKFEIEYHFFPSYHGHSSCDAAAAHSKKQLNIYQRNNGTPISDSKGAAEIISTVNNHWAGLAPIIERPKKIEISTLNGIRKMHKFKFVSEGVIKGWEYEDSTVAHIFEIKKKYFPTINLVQETSENTTLQNNLRVEVT
jgi:hypothetical protein